MIFFIDVPTMSRSYCAYELRQLKIVISFGEHPRRLFPSKHISQCITVGIRAGGKHILQQAVVELSLVKHFCIAFRVFDFYAKVPPVSEGDCAFEILTRIFRPAAECGRA
jgi:hypothetical protein